MTLQERSATKRIEAPGTPSKNILKNEPSRGLNVTPLRNYFTRKSSKQVRTNDVSYLISKHGGHLGRSNSMHSGLVTITFKSLLSQTLAAFRGRSGRGRFPLGVHLLLHLFDCSTCIYLYFADTVERALYVLSSIYLRRDQILFAMVGNRGGYNGTVFIACRNLVRR